VLRGQRYGWDRFDALLAETPWLFAGSSMLLSMAIVEAQRTIVARHVQRQQAPPSQEARFRSTLSESLPPTGRLLGSVTSEREARALITEAQPQLLICTDQLEQGSWVSLVRWLKRGKLATKTAVVVCQPNGFKVAAAWQSQTDALIADPLAGEGNNLLGLATILKGERFFDPKLNTYLQERGLDWDPQLSARELAVMAAVAEGLGDRQIAARMGLAYDTLKYVLKGIYNKLGVSNRVQASILLERVGVLCWGASSCESSCEKICELRYW
jgi:DNA-binding NarL/FixJ family response regulator